MAGVNAAFANPARRGAIRALLDDTSPSVRGALLEVFREEGETGLNLLREWSLDDPDGGVRAAARECLEELVGPDVVAEFREFIRSLHYELESGVLLLNRVVRPELDTTALYRELNAIANRCRELVARPASIRQLCQVINRVLFHEYGFRGNTEDFENPANSLLGEVMRTRKGLPLTLGVIYLLVARRLGLEFEPICLPGRFMIACYGASGPVYVDAYERGRLRTPEEVETFLEDSGLPFDAVDLAPSSTGEVLLRFCRNLENHYRAQGDSRMADLFMDFVLEFAETYRRSTS